MQNRDESSGGGAQNAKRKSSNICCCLRKRDMLYQNLPLPEKSSNFARRTNMELPPVVIFEPGKHDYLIPAFAFIHEDCIEADFTLATFQPPFQHQNPEVPDPRVLKYWSNNAARVVEDTKVMFMQMAISESGHEELAGYVVLASQASETGPFRGSVEKLLVSPRYRRRGIARLLMSKLEEVARVRGTTLLTLDTEAGSPAEGIYPRLGYTRLGEIPRYGVSPKDGRLVDEVFFYRDLRST